MGEQSSKLRTVSAIILAVLALVGTLYLGRDFLVPIFFAFYLDAAFKPIVRIFRAARVPQMVSATIIVLGLAAVLVIGGMSLSRPLKEWIASAPQSLSRAEAKLNKLRKPVDQVTDAASQIERVARGPATHAATVSADGSQPPTSQPVVTIPVQSPAIAGQFFSEIAAVITGLVEVLMLLYLLLASGNLFQAKLIKVVPLVKDKKAVVQIVADVESAIVRYFGVNAGINLAQGITIAVIMWLLGMPAPILWGVLTFALEFVPYLGAAAMMAMLGITSLATFDNLGHILLVPGSYLAVTTIQNNIISPIAYGQRLKLNPVVIFIGVLFWWFIWGLGGAFLAVPILATVKIVCDRTQCSAALSELLGE